MKPKKPDTHADLFRARLSQMLDPKEPLLILGEKIDWEEMEEELGGLHAPGPGQPPLPTRLMAGLHFLKRAHDMSDERVVEIWRQNPYWQAFCGYEHMRMKAPLHSSGMTRWRERVGERLDCLLTQTIRVARREGFLGARELERVNVDTTVQEKAVAFPTDARLYHKARAVLVREARKRDVALRQSYKRVYRDQGYRGHGVSGETRAHVVGKIPKTATRTARKWMKRRAAIEPTIGHLKSDHRLHRNRLKGRSGDRANAVLAAAGYNFAKLLAGFSRAWRNFREFLLRGRILGLSRRFSLRPA